jgi:16S rRNA (uracil1498-N3)-methyltransferase
MASPWFFVDSIPASGGVWWLPRDEAKHATGAKRLAPGDAVVLFDGRGGRADAQLTSERSRDGSLAVVVRESIVVERSGPFLRIASALPKGDRLATLVDMTTQLGIAGFVPLRCERSVVAETEHRAERMRRIQIEACKQARCLFLPSLDAESTVAELAARPEPARGVLVLADPSGAPLDDVRRAIAGRDATACIGPEGGFTEEETKRLERAGALRCALGPTILRIETAAVVCAAALRASGTAV